MPSLKLILSLLLSIGTYTYLQSQAYVLSTAIPVTVQGDTLTAAWAGGLNSPQFSAMDLDGDSHIDLVVFDRYDETILTFLNSGLPNQVDYRYAPEYEALFPSDLVAWALLRDYNGDGHMDIFTATPSGSNIRVFRNNAANNGGQIQFVLEEDTIQTTYPPVRYLYAPRSDIPSIEDMDGDGDLDILSFDVGGSFVEFHRNTSMETLGNLSGLSYEVESICYGHFRESSSGCTATIGLAPCQSGNKLQNPVPTPMSGARHAGSTLLSLDLNGDNVNDLLVGDISCTHIYALFGSDTSAVAHFDSIETDYPFADVPVEIPYFPAAYYIDVDNDGVKDLICAPNQTGNVEDKAGVWRYKNDGANNYPLLQREEVGFLQNEMIEIGSGAIPLLFDFNADGLTDLLVAGLGRTDSAGGYHAAMHLFENTGTTAQAAFSLVDPDYLGLGSSPAFDGLDYFAPTLGDLDGDGDQDMLIGDRAGNLHHFRNDGGGSAPANFAFTTSSYFNINADLFTHPFLYDLDGDGDQDLLIGNIRGDIQYYQNIGSPTSPNFILQTGFFGGIEITDFTGQSFTNGFARPMVTDYDDDGDLEVLVGTIEGLIEVYEDFSLSPNAQFTYAGNLFNTDFGRQSCLSTGTIDSTGAPAYAIGNFRGGLNLYTFTGTVSTPKPKPEALSLDIFPNPTTGRLQIRIKGPGQARSYQWTIVDIFGRTILRNQFKGQETELDLSTLPAGVYTLVLQNANGLLSKKLVKQ